MKHQRDIQRKLRAVEQTDLGPWPDEWRLHQQKGWVDALRWVLKTENAARAAEHAPDFEQTEILEAEG